MGEARAEGEALRQSSSPVEKGEGVWFTGRTAVWVVVHRRICKCTVQEFLQVRSLSQDKSVFLIPVVLMRIVLSPSMASTEAKVGACSHFDSR